MEYNWTQIKWPYNDDAPYCNWECWQLTAHNRTVILHPGQWPKEGWSYVVKHSHSGFLKGYVTLASAKARIEEIIDTL